MFLYKKVLMDIIKAKDLIYYLSLRDISVRYKQTVLGFAWTVLRPLLSTFAFTLVFNKFLKVESDTNVPYTVIVLLGMLPWILFSTLVQDVSNSIISNQNLVTKVSFPRIALPLSASAVSLVDFLVSCVLLACFYIFSDFYMRVNFVSAVFYIGCIYMFAFSLGLILASLNVRYRDFRYVVPFSLQLLMYVSPIAYQGSVIEKKYEIIKIINPLFTLIDGFRNSVLVAESIEWMVLLYIVVAMTLSLALSLYVFIKTEKSIADII